MSAGLDPTAVSATEARSLAEEACVFGMPLVYIAVQIDTDKFGYQRIDLADVVTVDVRVGLPQIIDMRVRDSQLIWSDVCLELAMSPFR